MTFRAFLWYNETWFTLMHSDVRDTWQAVCPKKVLKLTMCACVQSQSVCALELSAHVGCIWHCWRAEGARHTASWVRSNNTAVKTWKVARIEDVDGGNGRVGVTGGWRKLRNMVLCRRRCALFWHVIRRMAAFRDNLAVRNGHYTLGNNPEERKFQPFWGGRLKSRKGACNFLLLNNNSCGSHLKHSNWMG